MVGADAPATVLASFEGDGLLKRLRTAGRGPAVETGKIEFSGTRMFLVDFTMDKGARPPATLMHRFTLLAAGSPGSPKDEVVPYTYAIAPIAVGAEVTVLGPPLSGRGVGGVEWMLRGWGCASWLGVAGEWADLFCAAVCD